MTRRNSKNRGRIRANSPGTTVEATEIRVMENGDIELDYSLSAGGGQTFGSITATLNDPDTGNAVASNVEDLTVDEGETATGTFVFTDENFFAPRPESVFGQLSYATDTGIVDESVAGVVEIPTGESRALDIAIGAGALLGGVFIINRLRD